MKNRRLVLVVCFVAIGLLASVKLFAQKITIDSTPNQYIGVNNYNDHLVNNLFTFSINLKSNNISLKGWSVKIKVNDQVQNAVGEKFDKLSKVKFRVNGSSILGQGAWRELSSMTSVNDKPIIDKLMTLNTPIETGENNHYKRIDIGFDVFVEGGSYLENLISDTEYRVYFTFTLLDSNDNPVAETPFTVTTLDLGVRPAAPVTPTFMLEVNANATLDFNTPEHYTRQVENNPINSWVNVTSKNSGYLITVKTNNPNFELIRNDSRVGGDATIPVSVVNVEMQSAGSGTSQGAKTLSSTTAQTLFIGTKKNNLQKLPVRYFITKTEAEKLATKTSGEYRAILTYTLEPN